MLGRRRELAARRACAAAAAVSPPVDLAACADALEAPGNGLYQHYFMRMLGEAYRRRHAARPDLFAAGRELGLRTVREYDDRITAPVRRLRERRAVLRALERRALARRDRPAGARPRRRRTTR